MSGPGSPFPSGSHLVITGGAGFVGSHMADRLLERGHRVTVVDNLCTGRHENIAHNAGNERFAFIEQDVCTPLTVPGPVACVLHLASPASPVDFARMPLEILRTGSQGTERALELAEEKGARFLLASTSEVYGDPEVFPQPESYWGRVNPIGPRSVYDEAKRYAEALTMAWRRHRGVSTQIARIFNTYGPRMRPDDGLAPGAPHWNVELTRARGGRPGAWTLEWHHAAHRFSLVPGFRGGTIHPWTDKTGQTAAAQGSALRAG